MNYTIACYKKAANDQMLYQGRYYNDVHFLESESNATYFSTYGEACAVAMDLSLSHKDMAFVVCDTIGNSLHTFVVI